ncbi:MAG: hypothetical protein ACO2PM_25475 [Pyrobaculum sp.]
MLLILVKSDDEEVARRAAGGKEALELLPGVYLSWSPKEKAVRAVEAVKRAVVERWEKSGEGPTLEVAVIELDERQYKALRPMALTIVEKMGSAMLEEMERLLQRMRSGKTSRDLTGWYRDLARRYERLLDACMALDLEPTIVARLKEKWKEVTLEAGRLLKK